jgi:hypothetical protein
MSGKPTVATVPPRFIVRLAAMGNLEQLFLHGGVYQICENVIFYFDAILVLSCVRNCPRFDLFQ